VVTLSRLNLNVLVDELTPALEYDHDIVGGLALYLGVTAIAQHLENEADGYMVLILEALPRSGPTFVG
jgi:hypothetical protein